MVEQGTHKPLVGGSNPPPATNAPDSSRPEPALARLGSPSSYRQPAPAYNDLVNGRPLWRENRAEQRIFSSPVALAFVRTPSGQRDEGLTGVIHGEDVGP